MHVFTMNTNGDIIDEYGSIVARLSDDSHIGDFLMGFRAGHGPVEGDIIRFGDVMSWEAACVSREQARKACRVTPQVPALPGMTPMGFKP